MYAMAVITVMAVVTVTVMTFSACYTSAELTCFVKGKVVGDYNGRHQK
jgi:hypothetical protein